MKIILMLFTLFILVQPVISQGLPAAYSSNVRIADSLYNAGDYLNSGKTYSKAFEANGWKGLSNHRYNAACSWALAGVADSAFFQLERIAQKANYTNYGHITTDTDLNSLHGDTGGSPC